LIINALKSLIISYNTDIERATIQIAVCLLFSKQQVIVALSMYSTVEQFGRLDIVINNAGINNEKNWEKTIEVNLVGTDIYSVLGLGCFAVICADRVWTCSCVWQDASEQCDYGVRINALCPAFVDTQLLQTVENEETMGKFVKFKDEFKQRMDKYGVLKPSLIAEGMMRIITDETLNGAVMKITCSKGIHFHTYEPLSA
uniref:15-hydroxyprostaglandin dehydrogenase n=1 Tax=Astyanax mexicanus TaxID=7994 RepID=A0A8B9HNJ1_ASTMX